MSTETFDAMEPLLKMAAQVPALAVLAYLVYAHGQQLKALVSGWQETLAQAEVTRSAAISKINDGSLAIQRESFEVMRELSVQLERNTATLQLIIRERKESD